MGAPTVYRWDDTSAPALVAGHAAGTPGSAVAVLKACLVDGYGSKSAAGWTREYTNGDDSMSVFRSSSVNGNGFYYQALHDATLYGGRTLQIKAFETMSAVDTGTGETGAVYGICSLTLDTVERPWIVIADDQCFYFFCWYDETGLASTFTTDPASCGMFAGDIVSAVAGDGYGSMVIGTNSSSYNHTRLGAMIAVTTASTTGTYAVRTSDGVTANKAVGIFPGGGPGNALQMGYGGAPHPFNTSDTIICRPSVNEGSSYTFRGWLPGLYYPAHAAPDDNFDTVTVDTLSLIAIRLHCNNGTYTCQVYVDTSTGFRP